MPINIDLVQQAHFAHNSRQTSALEGNIILEQTLQDKSHSSHKTNRIHGLKKNIRSFALTSKAR